MGFHGSSGMNIARTFVIQISSFAAMWILMLGNDYMTIGHGLHPVISGSAATLLVLLPHLLSIGEERVW
jgi:hypothetical protein